MRHRLSLFLYFNLDEMRYFTLDDIGFSVITL